MTPYWQSSDGRHTIYNGDCLQIMPQLAGPFDAVITDPVWPNAVADIAGRDDPDALFAAASDSFARLTRRVVVQLGCDSDPRILRHMPDSLPFFRVCWLEYVRPHYKGRLLYTSDVAYVFGDAPPSEPGAHIMPGRMIQHDAAKRHEGHPCPRQLQHVVWIARWFARGDVLDPFAGICTTGVACIRTGRRSVCIELEERYCEIGAKRMEKALDAYQEPLPLDVPAAKPVTTQPALLEA